VSDALKQTRRNALARAHFGLTRIPRQSVGLSDAGAAFIGETFPAGLSADAARLDIANALDIFDMREAEGSREAQAAQPAGGRGRPHYAALDELLTTIIATWRRELLSLEHGITRTNSSGQGQQYHGPLLAFVERLLKIEGVGYSFREGVADYTSNKSLGKRLLRLAK
jgi:hypothetical protein